MDLVPVLLHLLDQEAVLFRQHLDFQLYLDQEEAQEVTQAVVVQETVSEVEAKDLDLVLSQ